MYGTLHGRQLAGETSADGKYRTGGFRLFFRRARLPNGGGVLGRGSGIFPAAHQTAVCQAEKEEREQKMKIRAPQKLKSLGLIRTTPFPGFPTDAQAPLMAVAAVSEGITVFSENIFESRYKHVGEFIRLGADIKVEGKVAVVEGVKKLYSAPLCAKDLRGSAALVVAGLAAEGTTEIDTTEYLERGYEDLDVVLKNLGASVSKI